MKKRIFVFRVFLTPDTSSAANQYYGLINQKKNGNYYVTAITGKIFKFYKLKVIK
ncbi:hypothetical protein [Methanobacterium subterraneum]|uniref:hypothetical protein n=1 Tax=Methanobacterium subterraneum TaxID=59277 RepID=UPI0012FDBAEA|nr:hypothetical protein [Methanobacterium subterraneum]